ncbi:MAG: 50S ribosomal protein L7Ae [Candidatus Diapherotrites archaeon]
MASYIKFSITDELKEKQTHLLDKIKKQGKIKVGSNEVTKAIERGNAKLVVIAEDVSPPEIVMHLPLICEEKNVPYSFGYSKKELGEKAGINTGTSAIVVINEGESKKELEDLAKKIQSLKK